LFILIKYGEISLAFSKIGVFLDEYKDDKNLIVQYIKCVGQHGNKDDINEAINYVNNWLEKNEDSSIFIRYISFVEEFGNKNQISNTIDKTCNWLENKNKFRLLWLGYLSLLKKTEDEKRISRGILKTLDWLKTNYNRYIILKLHILILKNKDIKLKQLYFDTIKKFIKETLYIIGKDEGLLLSLCAGVAWDFKPEKEIRSLYEKALRKPHPIMNKTRFFYAKYLVIIEDFLTALSLLSSICNCKSPSPIELDLYATCLAKLGKFEKAESTWLDCINKSDPKGIFINNLAKFYRDQERFDEARVQFKNALKLSPTFWWAHKEWGELEYLDGNISDAWLHFEKAIKLIPASKKYNEARQSIQERAQEIFGKVPG
jgi:tetratricopeptide (TPR) repeat protein